MNARQARRIVLWMNGHYMIAADHVGLEDHEIDALSEEDLRRLQEQQCAIGLEMIRRSGIDLHMDKSLVVAAALGAMPEEEPKESR
jgi:hypothetical protein